VEPSQPVADAIAGFAERQLTDTIVCPAAPTGRALST
jgi:hypothetical protein